MERWRILHKTSDFTVIDNGIFRDSDLSLAEVGLLCKILSLPEGWHFRIDGIVSTICEGEKHVYAIIRRLIEHGYCKREQSKDAKTGRYMSYDYTFYEVKNGLGCDSAPQLPSRDADLRDAESRRAEKEAIIKDYKDKVPIKSSTDKKKDISISKEKFDFVSALVGIGVSREAAVEWLQVRKTKRATNTKIAFDRIAREIAKSGRSADECIRFSVEHSYSGFEAEWIPKAPQEKYEYFGDIEGYINARKNGLITR